MTAAPTERKDNIFKTALMRLLEKFTDADRAFHNPLKDPKQRLMSRRESFFAYGLPVIFSTAALALTAPLIAWSSLMINFSLIIPALITGHWMKSKNQRLRLNKNSVLKFDLNKTEDCQILDALMSPGHSKFAESYITLAKKSGLDEIPLLCIDTSNNHGAYTFSIGLLRPKSVIYFPAYESHYKTEKILATAAHEMGHIKNGDTKALNTSNLIFSFSLMSLITASSAVNTNFILPALNSGILMNVAAIVTMLPAASAGIYFLNKTRRHNEHRCDRFSAVTTGNAAIYSKYISRDDHNPKPENLRDAFKRAAQRITSTHPPSSLRAKWLARFAAENPEYCAKVQAELRSPSPKNM